MRTDTVLLELWMMFGFAIHGRLRTLMSMMLSRQSRPLFETGVLHESWKKDKKNKVHGVSVHSGHTDLVHIAVHELFIKNRYQSQMPYRIVNTSRIATQHATTIPNPITAANPRLNPLLLHHQAIQPIILIQSSSSINVERVGDGIRYLHSTISHHDNVNLPPDFDCDCETRSSHI